MDGINLRHYCFHRRTDEDSRLRKSCHDGAGGNPVKDSDPFSKKAGASAAA